MKILVIDDNPLHVSSATQAFVGSGHELTIAHTYDEAHKLLQEPRASWEAVDAELVRRGFKKAYDQTATEEERAATWKEKEKLEQELCPLPLFDAVLCDLLMPASKMTMGEKGLKYVGQEMPIGFALSLMAVVSGAKFVAVVTDTNHHDHPASAWLDPIDSRVPHKNDSGGCPPRFTINGAKVGYYHSPMRHVDGTTCTACGGTGDKEVCHCVERNGGTPKANCDSCEGKGRYCWTCKNSGKLWGKAWDKVLAHLTAT